MRGVEVRILDPDHPDPSRPLPLGQVGHVAVRAPSMYAGYHAAPQEDADALIDGFFLTGDLGRLDADHTLTITGRLKLLIDIGGIKVNPLEVEQQLLDHPDVAECVVVPDPVSPTISRVKAILTAADPALDLDPTALRRYLRPRLAGHKIPRTFEVRPALPKTATGKVLRRQLLPRRASA
jgi:acyl-CoA synthetase (AMP-forming)/AMP-acid ligase II